MSMEKGQDDVQAQTDRAREVLVEILHRMGIEATIETRDEGEKTVLDVKGADAALVIGKKGQTLEALQFLLAKIVHKGKEGSELALRSIVVDAEGYRARREAALIEMANRLGEKVRATGRPITVNQMSPQERRIIHMTLDKVAGVTTRSEGEGLDRRLLIVPAPDKA
jgi:spoIIIJ-associated protein